MIAVFLADGFEEIEALAVVDLLRRASLEVCTVGVGTTTPQGAHGITVIADINEEALVLSSLDAVVLPGGMPGTRNLEASSAVQKAISYAVENALPIGAICAAPSILGRGGYLTKKQAACYPGFEEELKGAVIAEQSVVTDGLFTTAAGAGVAVDFALELVARLCNREAAQTIREAIQCP